MNLETTEISILARSFLFCIKTPPPSVLQPIVKVKLVLSLCLIKYHAFLTSALDGGEWSVLRPGLFTSGQKTLYPLDRRLGGPQSRSGRCGEEKYFLSLKLQNECKGIVRTFSYMVDLNYVSLETKSIVFR
jgi:hypothetical protein